MHNYFGMKSEAAFGNFKKLFENSCRRRSKLEDQNFKGKMGIEVKSRPINEWVRKRGPLMDGLEQEAH